MIRSRKDKMIETSIIVRIKLCWKIIKTAGYSEGYTIKELIEDKF